MSNDVLRLGGIVKRSTKELEPRSINLSYYFGIEMFKRLPLLLVRKGRKSTHTHITEMVICRWPHYSKGGTQFKSRGRSFP